VAGSTVGEPILLVSVSARMLAELGVRAGHDVVALDRFGDLDLQWLCPSVSVLRDLGGRGGMAALVDAAEEIPAPSVIYGAGLENQPGLVARLASGRRLLGCPSETIERVRDPASLGASLRGAGLAYPLTFGASDAPRRAERSRRWLRKPVRGGGGRGIREWRGGALDGEVVVQERISGLACSAAAVADGRSAVVLGVSEQLIGHRGLGARGYAWCGNLVPPRLGESQRRSLAVAARTICAHLALEFGLRGLFGVDLVWDGERAWVVEINPRPTGSLECVEAAHEVENAAGLRGSGSRPVHVSIGGRSPGVENAAGLRGSGSRPVHVSIGGRSPGLGVFAAHLEGCAGRLPSIAPDPTPRRAAGKAILFATRDVRVGDTRGWPALGIRDVPHPHERIAAGRPICTLVSVQESPEAVLADLEARAATLRAELGERVEIGAHA
jgi:predicted ATP-grasp superfamily ATP-dependent carboligase